MRSSRLGIALVGLGCALLLAGCGGGGGGGGKKNPFPGEVKSLFPDVEAAFRSGTPNLPISITCGIVGNPMDVTNFTQIEDIVGQRDHSGTVAQATIDFSETRNGKGGATLRITVVDSNSPTRTFLDITAQSKSMKISWSPPPLGAKDFLASDGTGQSFALATVEANFKWTQDFENDPVGGGGTLVDFTGNGAGGGGVAIPVPGNSASGSSGHREVFLVEFLIQPGPSGNTACVASIRRVHDFETFNRDGSGSAIDFIEHDHDVRLGPGMVAAYSKQGNDAIAVVPDPDPTGPVMDGDTIQIANGVILGGIQNWPSPLNESQVDDAGGSVILISDGVPNVTDGDFDGVANYNLSLQLDVQNGVGGVNNGIVDVEILVIETSQEEDPSGEDLDHPILDELLLYGELASVAETGIIIYH